MSKRQAIVILSILWLFLLRGVMYSAIIPPWQAPDEFRHFEYIRLIMDNRRLVDYDDLSQPLQEEIIASMVDHRYWRFGYTPLPYDPSDPPRTFEEVVPPVYAHMLYQPPLYYALAALWLLPFSEANVTTQLLVARLFSVLLGASTVIVAFLTIRQVFPDEPFMTIGVPMVITILPMHTLISSSANSDNLAELLVSLTVLALVRVVMHERVLLATFAVPLLLVLAWFTKRTALIGLPLALASLAIWFWSRRIRLSGRLLLGLATVLVLILLPTLWALSQGYLDSFLAQAKAHLIIPKSVGEVVQEGGVLSRAAIPLYLDFLVVLFESFWARFGWMNVSVAPAWYRAAGMATLVALLGLLLFAIRALKGEISLSREKCGAIILLGLAVPIALAFILAGMVQVRSIVPEALPQGRYLFPVIVPLVFFLLLGWREVVPQRWRLQLLLVLLNAFFFFDLACLIYYLIPYYYG